MLDALGSETVLRYIRADVRDPNEVWFGLLLARIIVVCCPASADAAAFFARKLFQASEERGPQSPYGNF